MKLSPSKLAAMAFGVVLSAAQAQLVSTNDLAAWQQSIDGTSWVAAQRGSGSYDASLNGTTVHGLWVDGVGEGPSIFFKTSFGLSAVPSSHLWVYVDDDVLLTVNGVTVINDTNTVSSQADNIDITSLLHTGTNTIDAKVSSYYCCGRTFNLTSDVVATPVPEPQGYALLLAGLGVVGCWARRREV